jgi:hypothetical protein
MVTIKANKNKCDIKCQCCGKPIHRDNTLVTIELKATFTKVKLCKDCIDKLIKEAKSQC